MTETPVSEPYVKSEMDHTGTDQWFDCQDVKYSVTTNYDQVLWLAGAQSAVKPGIVLQGEAFNRGSLQAVPLRRAPVTLSIDLGVAGNASRTVENPSTATLQAAIAELQQEAESLADLPSTLSFSSEEITSSKQLTYALGVHAAYSGLVVSASLDANFSRSTGTTEHTITAKLVQPMYTISFADDELALPSQFFAPDLSDEEWNAQKDLGTMSDANPPVFVSSVTYGRMLMFTIASTEGESATDLEVAVRAATSSFEAGAEADVHMRETLKRSKIQVLAIGGSSEAASSALSNSDLSRFFAKTNATGAVPISFVVRTVAGTRPVARLGDVTEFTASKCEAMTGGRWVPKTPEGEIYTSISAGSANHVIAMRGGAAPGVVSYDAASDSFVDFISATDVKQVSLGIDGTIGLLDNNGSIFTQPAGAGAFSQVPGWCEALDVYDARSMVCAGGNDELYMATDGYHFYPIGGRSQHVSIDGNARVWVTGLSAGVWSRYPTTDWAMIDADGLPNQATYIAVGAPDQVYAVSEGNNYQLKNGAWSRIAGNMTQIEVGFDGQLWGIGPDGRIYQHIGANP